MFVRFRHLAGRLQVAVVENRREQGRVRQATVATLGSVPFELSVADRVVFWRSLHERMTALSNRIAPEAQAKLLTSIHNRVPMPTVDDQRRLQLANAEDDDDAESAKP